MRQEFIEIVNEIASDSVTDDKLLHEVKTVVKQKCDQAVARGNDDYSEVGVSERSKLSANKEKIEVSPLDERKPSAVDQTEATR
jgi:hypothetical protein